MPTLKNALIIGASRGLGLGLVERLTEAGWAVTATVRDTSKATALAALPGVTVEALDMNELSQVDALSERLQGEKYDVVFVNAGVMGPTGDLDNVTPADLGELFMTNALSPIRLAARFVDRIAPEHGILAFMSSTLGTVTSPDAAEAALYKASKAALNSMTNTFISQLPEKRPTVLSLHPGWVKTEMGGPGADIDIATSTRGLLQQLEAYAGKGGHHFVNYRGEILPW